MTMTIVHDNQSTLNKCGFSLKLDGRNCGR